MEQVQDQNVEQEVQEEAQEEAGFKWPPLESNP